MQGKWHAKPSPEPSILILLPLMTISPDFFIEIDDWPAVMVMSPLESILMPSADQVVFLAEVMTTEPVFAAVFAVLLGGESLGPRVLLGGALVLAAMYLVELAPRRHRV